MKLRNTIEKIGSVLYGVATAGLEKEHTFSRFGMYQGIGTAAADKKFTGPALSISHSRHLLTVLGAPDLDVTEANFPEVNILNLPFGDNVFGLVVSDQVFEHIQGLPSAAFKETLRVTRPGGWVLHTTCFMTPYHGPGDYWRYSAEGLRELAIICGASEVIARASGHMLAPLVNLLGWTRRGVPKAKWHPLRWLAGMHHPSYATLVWVLARK